MRWSSSRKIEAPIEIVWGLTENIEAWSEVTPKTILSVTRHSDGPLAVGCRATLKQPGQMPAVWEVTALEPPHLFVWQTKVLGLRLVATHRLSSEGSGTLNELLLEISGFGSGLFCGLLGGKVQTAIDTENDAFKAQAEQSALNQA